MEELSSQKDSFTDQIHVLEVELRDTKNDRDSKKSLVDDLREKITARSQEKVNNLRPNSIHGGARPRFALRWGQGRVAYRHILNIFSQSNNTITTSSSAC